MNEFTKDQMICFLWDQVKRLSAWTRQRDGEVQKGYADMCKLENKGLIKHLIVEAHEAIGVEPEWTDTSAPIENTTELLPIPEVVEIIEEVIEPEPIPEPEPEIKETVKELTEDNLDELLEQYKKELTKE